jgi:hypothetical protein
LREKEKRFEPREMGWAIARHAPSGNSLLYRAVFGGDVTTEILFRLPGFRWEIVENAKGARFFTLTCLTPENDRSTRITQLTYWRGAPLLNLALPFAIPMAKEFLDQDGRMVGGCAGDQRIGGVGLGPIGRAGPGRAGRADPPCRVRCAVGRRPRRLLGVV